MPVVWRAPADVSGAVPQSRPLGSPELCRQDLLERTCSHLLAKPAREQYLSKPVQVRHHHHKNPNYAILNKVCEQDIYPLPLWQCNAKKFIRGKPFYLKELLFCVCCQGIEI